MGVVRKLTYSLLFFSLLFSGTLSEGGGNPFFIGQEMREALKIGCGGGYSHRPGAVRAFIVFNCFNGVVLWVDNDYKVIYYSVLIGYGALVFERERSEIARERADVTFVSSAGREVCWGKKENTICIKFVFQGNTYPVFVSEGKERKSND